MRPSPLNLSFTLEKLVRGNAALVGAVALLCLWGAWALVGLWRLYQSFRHIEPRHEKTDKTDDE